MCGTGLAVCPPTVNTSLQNWHWILCVALLGCTPAPVIPQEDAGVIEPDAGTPDAGAVALVPVWTATTAAPVPTGLWGTVLTFDPQDRRFILHGGNTYPAGSVVSDTWSFSITDQQWTKLTTSGDLPPVRYCHCATYLPNQKQVLIAGGRDATGLVDSAYTLDLESLRWTQVTGTVPSGAIGCNAHWMPQLSRAIVFGGDGRSGVNANTWSYEPVARTFTLLTPTTKPPARRDAMSIYEPTQGKVVLFGGAVAITSSYLQDVAVFDGSTWDFGTPAPHPRARRYGATGYDALHAKWLLFSGTDDSDDFDDLWVIDPLSLSFEEVQAVAPRPAKRGFSASGIDEVTGTLYVFGGLTTPGFEALADGWTLKLTAQ